MENNFELKFGFWGQVWEEHERLLSVLAVKRLDGHDARDQWLMALERKLGELIDVIEEEPAIVGEEEPTVEEPAVEETI